MADLPPTVGSRCGEEKEHKGSHVLYSADGESTLYSEGWEQRDGR